MNFTRCRYKLLQETIGNLGVGAIEGLSVSRVTSGNLVKILEKVGLGKWKSGAGNRPKSICLSGLELLNAISSHPTLKFALFSCFSPSNSYRFKGLANPLKSFSKLSLDPNFI